MLGRCCENIDKRVRAVFDEPGSPIDRVRRAIYEMWAVRRDGTPEMRVMSELHTLARQNVALRTALGVAWRRAREQIIEKEDRLPDVLVACVGGGSNSIGLFHPFLSDNVRMIGVEAGGRGETLGEHAARFMTGGNVGVLQGTKSYLLQNDDGQIALTHSVSAGLDYASIGPEHAFLHDMSRVEYATANDEEALAAFKTLSETEGIIPALESSHAIAHAIKIAPEMGRDQIMIVNLSGRGDKDINTVQEELVRKHDR